MCIRDRCIPATNDKEWQPSWSRLPSVEINGNEIVVKDVRSFIYRTERDLSLIHIDVYKRQGQAFRRG